MRVVGLTLSFVAGIELNWADEVSLWSEILSQRRRHNVVTYLLVLGEILGIEKNLCSEFSMKEAVTISNSSPQLRLRLPLFFNHFLAISYLSLFVAECKLFCAKAKMEDTDEIEDIYEINDTDKFGLCFRDAKYYDVPALGKDNCLNEDSERELRQKLEDPMIKLREADKPPYEEFPPADKINDDMYTSEGYYALKGKEVNSLTYEDLKDIAFRNVKEGEKFYGYHYFVIGFCKRVYKNDKVTINGVEHVSRKVWCCSKEGCEKNAANGKPDVVHNSEMETEEQHASEDETCLKKRKKKNNVVRGWKYSRIGCEAVFVLRLDKKTMLYTVRKFVTEHNHGLVEPVERQFLSCFREVTEDDISVVLTLRTTHVPTSVTYEFLALQVEGPSIC
ncbi:hypothetical protein ACLB2K_072511 [Fragaria x ananassa]